MFPVKSFTLHDPPVKLPTFRSKKNRVSIRAGAGAYITAMGTAVPAHRFDQSRIADFMVRAMKLSGQDERRLRALYRSTRIDFRHSVLPDYGEERGTYTFYPNTPELEPFPTVQQRMIAYRQYAVGLAEAALRDCLATQNIKPEEITHLITVSCTGMYAPGPDIELIGRLGLRSSVHRLAVNFMGCYGAFNGLKAASALVKADPEAKVLVVCVELCTLHFQKKNEEDHWLANALFADGAAAVLMEGKSRKDDSLEASQKEYALEIVDFACEVLPDGKDDMAWHISDFGFEMKLTSRVPEILRTGLSSVLERLTRAAGIRPDDVNLYAIHPGGRRILEVVEEVLGLTHEDNAAAYATLRDYGNMSSATILFVLKKLWELNHQSAGDYIFASAFGPGLTAETALLKIV
ncbi:type III polyketide synthase [Salmonirosea aquatica]|uniref:Type III polyketide synthase n=1 Tax=Salmonirosea aquatica TaxID=2654236 RepID=A0A7C9BJ02_9BACT|nr:type III polyketide synthase [Cytophagaceae bacterium SJW1-29]